MGRFELSPIQIIQSRAMSSRKLKYESWKMLVNMQPGRYRIRSDRNFFFYYVILEEYYDGKWVKIDYLGDWWIR